MKYNRYDLETVNRLIVTLLEDYKSNQNTVINHNHLNKLADSLSKVNKFATDILRKQEIEKLLGIAEDDNIQNVQIPNIDNEMYNLNILIENMKNSIIINQNLILSVSRMECLVRYFNTLYNTLLYVKTLPNYLRDETLEEE